MLEMDEKAETGYYAVYDMLTDSFVTDEGEWLFSSHERADSEAKYEYERVGATCYVAHFDERPSSPEQALDVLGFRSYS